MMGKVDLPQVSWLATARLQARRLTEVRLEQPRRALVFGIERASTTWTRLCAAALALALALGSAAWAWVRRDPAVPSLGAGVARAAVVVSSARPAPATTPATTLQKNALRKKRVPPKTVLPERPVMPPRDVTFEDEGPDGDVIVGRAPLKQPPLFTTEEYKARGVMVR